METSILRMDTAWLSAPRPTGRRRRAGTPLADILHAYRIGFTELWEAIVEEARRARPRLVAM